MVGKAIIFKLIVDFIMFSATLCLFFDVSVKLLFLSGVIE